MSSDVNISVAIPLFNEESNVLELLSRVTNVLDLLPGDHQIVLVDDGSTDGTLRVVETAIEKDPRILAIALSRNFGHQAAISAALDHVTGDAVVVMDGDLQDSPDTIPKFIDEYRKGNEVVYAIRQNRKEGWLKRTSYGLFYRSFSLLVDLNMPLDAGDFGLMSRRVVDLLRRSKERQRFLRGLRAWYGFKQVGVLVERDERYSGQSKYTLSKLIGLAFDGIFAFSTVPIRLAIFAGATAIGCAFIYAFYAMFVRFNFPASEQAPAGFTATILLITFLSGVHLMFAGIIGEYVGRIYEEVKQRPIYVVDRIIGNP